MSPGNERAPALTGALTQSVTKPDETKSSRRTQYERVVAVLMANDEVCGSELYRMFIPRFGSILHRMKKNGYVWSKRSCDRHDHHEGTGWLYRLEALPTLPGIGDA